MEFQALDTTPPIDALPTDASHRLIHDCILHWLREEAQLTVEKVDYDTSLFEMGVTSMGAAMIAGELETRFEKRLDPDVLFGLETINELAGYIDTVPRSAKSQAHLESPAAQPLGLPSTSMEPCSELGESAPSAVDHLAHFERLNRRIRSLQERDLYFFEPVISEHDGAWVVADGQRMLMLGSYEYLGLLGHPHLKQTAIKAIEEFGTGHHGVRLLAGTTTIHKQLEAKLAHIMEAADAVVFSSGFVTNLATISALVGRGDCVIGDQWNHASIVDGCRMSGADFLEFKHNDTQDLEAMLRRAGGRRTLVVVDAVYSMDGDIADLPSIVELCQQYNALLMVDEAHSLGVLGATGRGVQEHFGLDPGDIDIKMGTLSKTLAGCGGFVACREEIATYLRHHARGYIFSGALPAGQASVAVAALEVLEREPEQVRQLQQNTNYYLEALQRHGFDTAKSVTPIVPVMTRNDQVTLEMTRLCRGDGLLVIPVAFPAVPADAPRLRTCVSAIHSRDDLDFAIDVLVRNGRKAGLIA